MKISKYIFITIAAVTFLTGCDFLNREPIDFGNEGSFFKREDDLRMFNNTFYVLFPAMKQYDGIYKTDNNSDNQTGSSPNTLFYRGDKLTPDLVNSAYNFENIRNLNFFINKIETKLANGEKIDGSTALINHYLGEAYFFKAYDYFRLLSNLGDVPLLNKVYGNDFELLVDASKRAPRNEIARAIIGWLDKSAELMVDVAPQKGRLSRDAAYLMKARVALYEATWEKYHAGTALVPGNSKWPGSKMYPDYQFPAGSAVAEYKYFFEQAVEAADIVAQKRPLYANYIDLFNDVKGTAVSSPEVILARYYITENGHGASHYLLRTGAGTGYTRSLVDSYLTKDGLPIYADPTYPGDAVMYDQMENRDLRLKNSVRIGGFLVDKTTGDTLVNYKPQIWVAGGQGSTTGYEVKKWISYEPGQDASVTSGKSATPIFRAAEAYLIYLEAYYELHGNLGGNCDTYWKALRKRAGVSEDYAKTIAATDLAKENDLAVKSKGKYVDATLYNIRRERRCEFIAEGARLNDLKRWRALDAMANYQIEGFNLWEDMYTKYRPDQLEAGMVSQSSVSKYLRPFQAVATSVIYNGYNFPKQHYLEPIPVSEIILTGGVNSPLFQNPGWPSSTVGPADYGYDMD